MTIIAFSGHSGSGKTTAAKICIKQFGGRIVSFADALKVTACDNFNWDRVKDDKGRRLLQDIGSIGRQYDPDIWIKKAHVRILDKKFDSVIQNRSIIYVDDLRYDNEADFIREHGGIIIVINRRKPLLLFRKILFKLGIIKNKPFEGLKGKARKHKSEKGITLHPDDMFLTNDCSLLVFENIVADWVKIKLEDS